MGFLFRAAAVVGLVYWLSPLSDTAGPPLQPQARDLVQRQVNRAAEAALEHCAADKAACLARAAEAATTGATSRRPEPTSSATSRALEPSPPPSRRSAERDPPKAAPDEKARVPR